MSNATNTATTTTTVEKNGLKFDLRRDETKAKAGKESTVFYNVPSASTLAGLNDSEKAAIATSGDTLTDAAKAAWTKCLNAYVVLLGLDKAVEYIESRLDVVMRASQTESGRDTLTMDQKLVRAVDYITKGDFGRNRQGGISGLVAKLDVERAEKEKLQKQLALMQKLMLHGATLTDAEKAAIQAELLALSAPTK